MSIDRRGAVPLILSALLLSGCAGSEVASKPLSSREAFSRRSYTDVPLRRRAYTGPWTANESLLTPSTYDGSEELIILTSRLYRPGNQRETKAVIEDRMGLEIPVEDALVQPAESLRSVRSLIIPEELFPNLTVVIFLKGGDRQTLQQLEQHAAEGWYVSVNQNEVNNRRALVTSATTQRYLVSRLSDGLYRG